MEVIRLELMVGIAYAWKLTGIDALKIRGFPKLGGTLLGVPIIRVIVFLGLYWGPLISGNYHNVADDGRTMP